MFDANVPPGRVPPTGTVTFLFTDIEGSTKLLEQLREHYAQVLADQRDILRAAFAQFNGYEVDTQGDAFFVAFPRALDAVNCVIQTQRALSAHPWIQNITVRVRMGLHTGEPILAHTGYISMDVHRAARIAGAGYGGQVLLSQTVRDLIEHDLPPDVTLRDLGLHKLKDFRTPTTIYQLVIAGLPSDFPPLKTLDREEEPPTPGDSPFKGLEYYDESDADNFFGRERVTAELVDYIRAQRFLAVVGASGSGKSSVVRAGLVPALNGHGITAQPGDSRWRTFILTPGAHPLEILAVTLTRDLESVTVTATLMDDLANDPRTLHLYLKRVTLDRRPPLIPSPSSLIPPHFLLVVDQFEELFTLCREEPERAAFINNLLYAANAQDGPTTLVLTLRADFYAALAPYPDLREAVAKHQEYIGPMTADEMRRAIQAPAERGGWEFHPGLVDLILNDVGNEPGALPLLSHALLETWKRRRGTLMMLKSYAEAGGVRGAIARTADRVFNQELTPAQQPIARSMLLRLTELGEGTADTRRRASLTELIPRAPFEQAQEAEAVLKHLADARLITTSEGSAEVAHEALIREWSTLREWLTQDREGLRLHRHVTEAAHEWELMEHDSGALYRGTRLAQAREFFAAYPEQLNELESAFLTASVENGEHEEREKEAARQRELLAKEQLLEAEKLRVEQEQAANQRLRGRALLLAGILVLALLAAGAAVFFGNSANLNAASAEQNALAASHAQATALANASIAQQAQIDDGKQLDEAQLQSRIATARQLAASALNQIGVDPERAIWLGLQAVKTTYNVDKSTLPEAVDSLHRAIQGSQIEYAITGLTPPMNSIAYSPDGTRVVTANQNNLAKVYDAKTGAELLILKGHEELGIHWAWLGGVVDAAFSPDGTRIVTSSSGDNTARVWDAKTGTQMQLLTGNGRGINSAAFSPDGKRIVTAGQDGSAIIWNAETGAALSSQQFDHQPEGANIATGGLWQAVFSPDGKYVATAGGESTTRVWNADAGEQIFQQPDFLTWSVAFSPDNRWLAAGGISGTVKIWDMQTKQELHTLDGHESAILKIKFSPDGKRLATASADHTVKLWDANTGQVLQTFTGHDGWVTSVDFSPDGQRLASSGAEGTAIIWDLASGKTLQTIHNPFDPKSRLDPEQIQYSPDSKRLYVNNAAKSADSNVKVYSAEPGTGGKLLYTISGLVGAWNASQISADGKRMAMRDIGKNGGTLIRIWDVSGNGPAAREVMSQTLPIEFWNNAGVTIDPRLSQVAIPTPDGNISVFDLATGKRQWLLDAKISSNGCMCSFSRDGQRLLTGGNNLPVKVWELTTGKELGTLNTGKADLWSVLYSPDRTRVAIADQSGKALVWDAENGSLLRTIYNPGQMYLASFNSDSKQLITANQDASAQVWDVETGQLLYTLLGHNDLVFNAIFSPDDKQIATSSGDGTIRLWSTTLQREGAIFPGGLPFSGLAADGNSFYTAENGDQVTVRRYERDDSAWSSTPSTTYTVPIASDDFEGMYLDPNSRFAVFGRSKGEVQIREAATGKEIVAFKAHNGQAYGAWFNPDYSRLLTYSDDGFAYVWDIADSLKNGSPPKQLFSLSGHGLAVNWAIYSPDSKQIATGTSGDGLIKIWDAATGKELKTLAGHKTSIFTMAFSGDGKLLASGSRDGSAKIWDVATGKELVQLIGHHGAVGNITFSDNNKWVATASWDGTTKIWDAATGQEQLSLNTPSSSGGTSAGIAFSRDDTRLYVSTQDGVREFVLPIEDLMQLARSRVTRILTSDECQTYLHQPTCPAP